MKIVIIEFILIVDFALNPVYQRVFVGDSKQAQLEKDRLSHLYDDSYTMFYLRHEHKSY